MGLQGMYMLIDVWTGLSSGTMLRANLGQGRRS